MNTSEIVVIGGIYREVCTWPQWDQVYGSAGRAAAALSSHVEKVTLHAYVAPDLAVSAQQLANAYGFHLVPHKAHESVEFEYTHCMSNPVIRPSLSALQQNGPIEVECEAALLFGMLEGSGRVYADRCVYDPQSAFTPELFWQDGRTARQLAIVCNRGEVMAMTGNATVEGAAQDLLARGAEVVVVKSGPLGAYVFTSGQQPSHVPAFSSNTVWTIGSGDVFAAVFAARWAVHRNPPSDAARVASIAVACYAETMALPSPLVDELSQSARGGASLVPGRVYLAGPFFNLGQRWLVDEARRCLLDLGLEVFSPVHDVGPGPAEQVAPQDIQALNGCDRVFAILDGADSGTVFEVGYARAKGIPVYALAQSVCEEDLKMVVGTGCQVRHDFVTALHHTAWKI